MFVNIRVGIRVRGLHLVFVLPRSAKIGLKHLGFETSDQNFTAYCTVESCLLVCQVLTEDRDYNYDHASLLDFTV